MCNERSRENARAAPLAYAHRNTPAVAHLDALRRTFLSIADNGSVVGASVPATRLRQTLDAVVGVGRAGKGNLGDAFNIAEAAGNGVDLFVTADAATIGKTFGLSGEILLPNSGGARLQFVVAKKK